jgi:Ala-tRNA(Pro) deacylase
MKEKVFSQLDETGLPYRVINHPAVFHVGDEPPELVGFPMTKNLLLRDRTTKQVYMVVMEGEKRLDIGALAAQLGSTKNRLQFVKFEEVEATVGVPPGHVSIFNLLNTEAEGVRIVFDEALLDKPEIGFHPNVNTATIAMKPADVITFLATHGHNPKIVSL